MAVYTFARSQEITAALDDVWEFISSPKNLKRITPEYMGFDIITPNLPDKMYNGMIISYKVSPIFGIKLLWVSEIKHIREKKFFVDEQRFGPYKLWHHQHSIKATEKGVMMDDIINYQPPLAFLGGIANHLLIKKQLNEIFDYRKTKLEEIFS